MEIPYPDWAPPIDKGEPEEPTAPATTAQPLAEMLDAAKAVDTDDWRPAVDEILELLDRSAKRRDELLVVLSEGLWWIALWAFLLFLSFLIGCPTVLIEIQK